MLLLQPLSKDFHVQHAEEALKPPQFGPIWPDLAQFGHTKSRTYAIQHEASGSVMEATDTAHSHSKDTAHSHSTVTAQSQSPPVSTNQHESSSSVMETTDTALATTLFVGEMLATEATSVKMMSKLPHKPVPRPQRRALLAADSHRRIVQAEPVDRRGQHRKVGLIGLKGCGMYTASDGKSPNQHPVSMSTTQSICGRRERGGVKSG